MRNPIISYWMKNNIFRDWMSIGGCTSTETIKNGLLQVTGLLQFSLFFRQVLSKWTGVERWLIINSRVGTRGHKWVQATSPTKDTQRPVTFPASKFRLILMVCLSTPTPRGSLFRPKAPTAMTSSRAPMIHRQEFHSVLVDRATIPSALNDVNPVVILYIWISLHSNHNLGSYTKVK